MIELCFRKPNHYTKKITWNSLRNFSDIKGNIIFRNAHLNLESLYYILIVLMTQNDRHKHYH